MMSLIRILIIIWVICGYVHAEEILTASIDTIKFGYTPSKSIVYHRIILRSASDDTIRIDSTHATDPVIKMTIPNNIIPPHDSTVMLLSFDTDLYIGYISRYPYIRYSGSPKALTIPVKIFPVANIEYLDPIYVKPYRVAASQYGDAAIAKFPFNIINRSKEPVPLELIYGQTEYFDVDMPVFVPAEDTVTGYITLNAEGLNSEFERSITFEYINSSSENMRYSIPVSRKIFKPIH